jgi:hypothetical protein
VATSSATTTTGRPKLMGMAIGRIMVLLREYSAAGDEAWMWGVSGRRCAYSRLTQ